LLSLQNADGNTALHLAFKKGEPENIKAWLGILDKETLKAF